MTQDPRFGKITVQHGDFEDDEPVFLLRGRDPQAADVLGHFVSLSTGANTPEHHVEDIRSAQQEFQTWQSQHPDKVQVASDRHSRSSSRKSSREE